jgi:hypothetical protein
MKLEYGGTIQLPDAAVVGAVVADYNVVGKVWRYSRTRDRRL